MVFCHDIEITREERNEIEKIYLLFENNMDLFVSWFEPEEEHHIKPFSEELQEKVRGYLKQFTVQQMMHTSRYYGMNVLHHLVFKNMKEEVKYLIEQGADPNARCVHNAGSPASLHYKGITPLLLACYTGNYEMVELLVSLGADPTLVDENNMGCQHYLCGALKPLPGRFIYKPLDEQREKIARFLKLDMNKLDKDGRSPFNFVCEMGQFIDSDHIRRMTEFYLELGMDPSKLSSRGIPLGYAINNRDTELFAMMVRTGAPLDVQDEDGDTLAHYVIMNNSGDNFLIYLYFHGVDFNIPNKKGETVYDYLKEHNSIDVYKILLKDEKDRTIKDYIKLAGEFDSKWDTDPICKEMLRFLTGKVVEAIDLDDDNGLELICELLRHVHGVTGYAIEAMHDNNFDFSASFIHDYMAAYLRDIILEYGDCAIAIPKLVEYGIDIDEALDGKNNLIYKMAKNYCIHSKYKKDFVSVLKYFSPDALTEICGEGASALHVIAALAEDPKLIEAAVEMGADINVTATKPAREGDTPLHAACRMKNLEMVKALMRAGADDTLTNEKGFTPAHAIFEVWNYYYQDEYNKYGSDGEYIGHNQSMGGQYTDLLNELENVDIVSNNNGLNPAMLMMKNGIINGEVREELIKIFIDRDIELECRDDNGDTLLTLASKAGHAANIVKLLFKAGADINSRNKDGNTALFFALKEKDLALARYLIKKGADYNVVNNRRETPAGIATEEGMSIVLELMTDIKVIDASDDEDMSMTDEEKIRAWEKDYGPQREFEDELDDFNRDYEGEGFHGDEDFYDEDDE